MIKKVAATLFLAGIAFWHSDATQLILNGDFETGNFNNWTIADQAGGSGSFFVSSPGASAPLSGMPTAGNSSGGAFYAVSDQTGPGAHALLQSFTVPAGGMSISLTFRMFVNNWSGGPAIVNPVGLDYTDGPNEHGRVDILTAGATTFDTGAGVLENLYIGSDVGTNPNA